MVIGSKAHEEDVVIRLVDESPVDDEVFKKVSYTQAESLKDDVEFRAPNVKTWVYSNMLDLDIWFIDSGFTFLASNNRYIFDNLNIYKRGVLVIKTLDFKLLSNKNRYPDIINGIFGDDSLPVAVRNGVLDKLKELSSTVSSINKNDVVRTTYFVPEEELDISKIIRVNDVLISKDANYMRSHRDNIYKEVGPLDPSDNCNVCISYTSLSGDDINVNILGMPLTLKGDNNDDIEESWRTNDSLSVSVSNISGRKHLGSVTRKELGDKGLLVGKEENDIGKDLAVGERKELIDSFNKRLDVDLTLTKFFHEHNVSLHKLFSYFSREEAALMALEKEEVSTAKEFLKLLGSIK